ncbi:MAG: phosphoethanolamine transferase [Flavobacteriales bacterium]
MFVLLNTNFDEAKDFVELKFSFYYLMIVPYVALFVYALKNQQLTAEQQPKNYFYATFLLLPIGFATENYVNDRFVRKGVPQTIEAFVSFAEEVKSYNKLKKRTIRKIDVKSATNQETGRTFVLILGESANRNHMSVYGYSRKTSPRLQKRNDIVLYDDVVSAYSVTLKSVLSMLTNSSIENNLNVDEAVSLIDVFHSAGFKTYWISNQSPIGVWDNAIYNIAQTSDHVVFVNKFGNSSFESTYLASYDEMIFEPLHVVLQDEAKNRFIVVHLMGSHSSYNKRYPLVFNKFNKYSSEKEQLINEYDNSMLYNDFVVDSVFSLLNTSALVNPNQLFSSIYLSDHSENVYDENNHIGHDYAGVMPKSNVEIPFVLWVSEGFKQYHESTYQTVVKNNNKPFIVDDLFHAVIDLNQLTYKGFYEEKSIFNIAYTPRKRVVEDGTDYDSK